MKRRNFIQAAAALSIPAFTPLSSIRGNSSSFTSLIAPDSDRVLVIVHLFGGNDGLNTLVPLDQMDGYLAVRPRLGLREGDVIKLTPTLGIHKRMGAMSNMFNDGKLGIVQSVGYPNQNRSHFRSTDIWTTASRADEVKRTGWVGRYLESRYPGYPQGYPNDNSPDPPAISIGNVSHPTCEGTNINFSQTVVDPENPIMLNDVLSNTLPNDRYGKELGFIRTTMRQTNSYNSVIEEAASLGRNLVDYPTNGNPLSRQLRQVARLIDGGLKTKVYTVYLGGFDLHANQVASASTGAHADLLTQVSDAIGAFQADIDALGHSERVLGMTFSEFGRRIRPNASLGTDHGTAGPMFLFGGCVQGGVLGKNVEVDPEVSQTAGVPMQFDFRDVYGSILVDWFDVPEFDVRSTIHDDFQYLPLAGKCNSTEFANSTSSVTKDGWTIGTPYPNPSNNEVYLTVDSPTASRLRYSLFDARGRLVLVNEIVVNGQEDRLLFRRPSRLPAGTYLLRLATEAGSTITRKVIFN